MTEKSKLKLFDLEDRTYNFAKTCRDFVKRLPRTVSNMEYGKQLIRASGSQASNYIEANEADTKKEFLYRIRFCRKETKEAHMWIKLCEAGNSKELLKEQEQLIQEAVELRNIFNSIYDKSK